MLQYFACITLHTVFSSIGSAGVIAARHGSFAGALFLACAFLPRLPGRNEEFDGAVERRRAALRVLTGGRASVDAVGKRIPTVYSAGRRFPRKPWQHCQVGQVIVESIQRCDKSVSRKRIADLKV